MQEETTSKIIEYYDKRVTQYGTTGQATLLDDNLRILEMETVQNWLEPSDKVLEIFCGNGVSTLQHSKHCESIVACDLSGKMIESARKNLSDQPTKVDNVTFEERNVLDIDKAYSEGQFNTVVSVRGLINLPSWELQKQAIEKVYNILPKSGKFIFLEGSKQGLDKLNNFRTKFSLTPLAEPWYDKYFDLPEFHEYINQYFTVEDERKLDLYFLVSRILYPFAALPNEAEFGNLCNTVARLLVPFAKTDTGTTLLTCLCLTKK